MSTNSHYGRQHSWPLIWKLKAFEHQPSKLDHHFLPQLYLILQSYIKYAYPLEQFGP
jgi:hypothetical protein